MKVLVFGGSGFLGSYVVDELINKGHEVTIFDRQPSKYIIRNTKMVVGDILTSSEVEKTVQDNEVIYNFAGFADLNRSIKCPSETINLNIIGNLNILEACRKYSVKRFVYASSAYVFSKKGGFYGVSKKCSEQLIEEYAGQFGLDYTVIRYGSVYGERAGASNRIYRILKQALTEEKITFAGDGTEEREYIHARDAACLSVQILDNKFINQHVILTGIERFNYADLLKMINEIMGSHLNIEMLHREYKGHYELTPYSFSPTIGVKLINNPCIDFGQGLLECIETIYKENTTDN